ncbi:hypothetical protein [Amycolatopsis sp. FDAARGOS 1241]|uniref:hypothetical protein n=1 Tax=Amycolatopsis sp. FDAARGOS 1241 TaxID=2778070 RepID=UPI0019520A7F|nr:hypothetical protein [Amycolatopsis sp. FDAARGOS 1241]QRP43271.1 hypothetical protein I6J71_28085 [Amycolatopsis sp. FDAARGOS 1241]
MAESTEHLTPVTDDERAELEQLRREVAELRTTRARRPWFSWRPVVSSILIVLGCILAPLALTSVWVNNQISDTDRFTATMSPLIRDPSVQAAVTNRVTDAIFTNINVQAIATDAVNALAAQGVPPAVTDRLDALTGPLASGVRSFVHGRVGDLVASDQIAQAWDRMIRVAHTQAVDVLNGSSSAIAIQGDKVVVDLAPFIDAAKQQLAADGLTVVNRIPQIHPTIPVADAAGLVKARSWYTTLDRLATWLPWIAIVLLAAGVYIARHKRRALVGAALGFSLSMLVLAIGLAIGRSIIIGEVPSQSAAPVAASFDIVVRFLRDGLRTLFAVGIVVALGAFLAGPSSTAVHIRQGVVKGLAWLRSRSGLRATGLGKWVHTYRVALRAGAVAIAVLVFLFLNQPSGLAVLLIAVVLLVVLAVIQFLDYPGDRPAQTG